MMKGNNNKKNYSVLESRGSARACSLVLFDVNVMAPCIHGTEERETSRQCAGHSSWPTAAAAAAAAAAGRLFSAFPFSKKV